MTTGNLLLRGADDPFQLLSPTTLTGTNDLGALSNVVLDTPAVTFVQDVPQYATTATITAAFSMVEPGTGFLNEQGDMTVQLRVAVDLHIVTPLLPDPRDCRAAPIALTLTSTAPYDGERVTLRAPNFSVPAVVQSPACNTVDAAVNEALAGAGHSFTLALAGAITPPPEGEPTATTLAVDPPAGSRLGEEVAITATVVPDPAVPGAPPVSGVVSFYDGDTAIGTAPVVEGGTATFSTTDLTAGLRQLRAEYGGAPPDWDPSESAPVPYTVTANPAVTTTAAGEVRIGGAGKDFDVTVINTGLGAALTEARLEVTIRRQVGTATIGPNAGNPRIVLSRVVDGTATPIPLTFTSSPAPARLTGTVGEAGTWLVPPGNEHAEVLRLAVASGVSVGPLSLTFALVTGEGTGKVTLGSASGVVTMINEARQATTVESGLPGFPGVTPPGVPITPVVRQGNVAELEFLRVTPTFSGVSGTGTFTVTIDGVPAQIQHTVLALPEAFVWKDRAPVSTSTPRYLIKVPSSTPTGTRQVTVRYSGDILFAPSQRTWPITVEQGIGTVYECIDAGITPKTFTVNLEVQASLPPMWPAGRDLPVDRVQVTLRLSRTLAQQNILSTVDTAGPEDRTWQLELGPAGTITMAGLTGTSTGPPPVAGDTLGPDHTITATGGTGTIPVSATPGDVLHTLDRIRITSDASGYNAGFTCEPASDPYEVGTVTAAGTTLVVDPGVVAGEGTPVALTATTYPAAAGVVEFRDGTETIGVVPVSDTGVARMTTSALPAGERSLTARFFGALTVTASPSAPVNLHIGVCGNTSAPGNAAVVRLVYLELLGRCPDTAGAAYWVGRLDGGTSQEAFARTIAVTSEAVGRVVDDAYQTMLGRPADASGRSFWTGRLQASGRYDRLLADLGASDEFWSKAGSSNDGFVTRVYDRLLHRAPDAAGLAYWTGRLDDGTSRRALVLTLANLDEPLGVLVTGSYQEILARTPDGTERTAGIGHLRSTGDRSGLYAQLIGLPEFSERAQGLPNPA